MCDEVCLLITAVPGRNKVWRSDIRTWRGVERFHTRLSGETRLALGVAKRGPLYFQARKVEPLDAPLNEWHAKQYAGDWVTMVKLIEWKPF
jgi:hypothetical protein